MQEAFGAKVAWVARVELVGIDGVGHEEDERWLQLGHEEAAEAEAAPVALDTTCTGHYYMRVQMPSPDTQPGREHSWPGVKKARKGKGRFVVMYTAGIGLAARFVDYREHTEDIDHSDLQPIAAPAIHIMLMLDLH